MDKDEFKPLLLTLIGKIDGLIGDVTVLKADMAELKTGVRQLKDDMSVVKPALARLETAQAVTSARLDEQRSVLAALIPTRIAAVAPAAE